MISHNLCLDGGNNNNNSKMFMMANAVSINMEAKRRNEQTNEGVCLYQLLKDIV